MAQLGADIAQLETMKTDFNNAAQDLEGIISKLNGSVHAAWWQGPDADTFRGDWDGQFKTQLGTVRDALTQTATTIDGQINEQKAASGMA